MSLFLSFLSVLQTLIQFNEWSKRRHTLHRMVLVVPFFAVTILYRVLALALILSFAGGKFGLLPVFGLLLTQVCMFFPCTRSMSYKKRCENKLVEFLIFV